MNIPNQLVSFWNVFTQKEFSPLASSLMFSWWSFSHHAVCTNCSREHIQTIGCLNRTHSSHWILCKTYRQPYRGTARLLCCCCNILPAFHSYIHSLLSLAHVRYVYRRATCPLLTTAKCLLNLSLYEWMQNALKLILSFPRFPCYKNMNTTGQTLYVYLLSISSQSTRVARWENISFAKKGYSIQISKLTNVNKVKHRKNFIAPAADQEWHWRAPRSVIT